MQREHTGITVETLISELDLKIAAGSQGVGRSVENGYCGDLLSDVMGNAPPGSVWITIQSHLNIVAVALLREMAAIVIAGGFMPDEETIARADKEGVPILSWPGSSYELAGELYGLGIGGQRNSKRDE